MKALYEFDEDRQHEIIKRHLSMPRGGEVTGPVEGAYGSIYSITLPHAPPALNRIAAKCPKIRKFGTRDLARSGIEQVLHELDKTHRIFMVPWVNRFFDVQFIHGWPFVLSQYRDGSLDQLIANPLAWSISDRFASLIVVTRALRLASRRGIAARQDLKPGNVFFEDLARRGVPKDSKGMHYCMFIGDFGLADAFRDFGRNSGSRPYMAPEQFSKSPINLESPAMFDVFALGVMAYECFSDGHHPIGENTADVWPWRQGISQKWNRESTWREWALDCCKTLPIELARIPNDVSDLILAALAVDPKARPSLDEFEQQLWKSLKRIDHQTAGGIQMQVEDIEGRSSVDPDWPHMNERLMQLRQFYSEF
jgi:serine/threonine protein kinase